MIKIKNVIGIFTDDIFSKEKEIQTKFFLVLEKYFKSTNFFIALVYLLLVFIYIKAAESRIFFLHLSVVRIPFSD